MYKFIVNKEKCINCGICVDICKSAKVYKFADGKVEADNKDRCWECGQCVAACPKGAIEYDVDTASGHEKKPPESMSNNGTLIDFLRERRSARLFKDEAVSRKTVEELLSSSRWIPTAQNQCDVQWLCIDDKEKIQLLCKKTVEAYKKTADLLKNPALKPILRIALGDSKYKQAVGNVSSFESLVEKYYKGEDPIFYNAPVVLFTTAPEDSYFGKENSIYAGYNLMLYAAQKGLSTCRIGYFDVALERDKQLQNIVLGEKSGRKIQTTIILGYSKYKFYNLIDREPIYISWNRI